MPSKKSTKKAVNAMTGDAKRPEFIPTQASDVSEISKGEVHEYLKGTNGKPSTKLVGELVAGQIGHVVQPEANHTVAVDPFAWTRKKTMMEGADS